MAAEPRRLRVATWNVLSNWWYVYKVFDRATPRGAPRAWGGGPSARGRRALTERYIASLDADVLCLQEINPASFIDDFAFLSTGALGHYDCVLEDSRNRYMRCAVFYRRDRLRVVASSTGFKYVAVRLEPAVPPPPSANMATAANTASAAHAASLRPGRPAPLHVVTVHLSAGCPKEGVGQLMAALKSAKKLMPPREDPRDVAVIVAGDFNLLDTDRADAPALHFLREGLIGKSYAYGKRPAAEASAAGATGAAAVGAAVGAPPEVGEASLEYRSKKAKRHPFGGMLRDAAEMLGQARPTFIVPDLFAKFKLDDEHFSPEFYTAVDAIFAQSQTSENNGAGPVMDADGIEAWICRIHGSPENRTMDGANQERLAKKVLEEKAAAAAAAAAAAVLVAGGMADDGNGGSTSTRDTDRAVLTLEDFRSIYEHECNVNPWSVDYDFLEFGVAWEDTARERPLFQRRLDRIFVSTENDTLQVHATEAQAASHQTALEQEAAWARAGRPVIPNEFHASDHLAVTCDVSWMNARPPRAVAPQKKKQKTNKQKKKTGDKRSNKKKEIEDAPQGEAAKTAQSSSIS
jgi:endonuclease/exonuclease/phosphatase family metal-dependent hydrolase